MSDIKNIGGTLAARLWSGFDRLLRAIICPVLRIFGRELTDEQWAGFMQFVKFGLVGVSNTLISYVVHCIFFWLTDNYYFASAMGFVISVLNSFYWNNKYVFRTNHTGLGSILLTLCKTFACYSLTGLVLNWALLYVLCDMWGISGYIAPLLILLVTIPLNFLLNKFWAFADRKSSDKEPANDSADNDIH